MPRYTIDLGNDFDTLLTELAKTKGITKAEVIRRAVASYAYLDEQVRMVNDKKLSITDLDDNVVKDVILP